MLPWYPGVPQQHLAGTKEPGLLLTQQRYIGPLHSAKMLQ